MNHEVTGWVAPLVSERLRTVFGLYHWHEYRDFATDINAIVIPKTMPPYIEAFRVHRFVYVNTELADRRAARCVWHELAHIVMHPANASWWEQYPWGALVIGKQERQAWEFAATFPVWDEQAALFWPN